MYAARENFTGFSSKQVVDRMEHPDARYIQGLEQTAAYLLKNVQPGDVILVLSAGDADQISIQVLQALHEREGRPV